MKQPIPSPERKTTEKQSKKTTPTTPIIPVSCKSGYQTAPFFASRAMSLPGRVPSNLCVMTWKEKPKRPKICMIVLDSVVLALGPDLTKDLPPSCPRGKSFNAALLLLMPNLLHTHSAAFQACLVATHGFPDVLWS